MWKTFFKLGVSAFGGPAAHIAMLEDEAVHKHQWIDEASFLELHSLTNIIPGPNSSEMVLGVGYHVSGVRGLLIAGVSFMLPSVVMVLLISMFFQSYIELPIIQVILNGMTPILLIMIAQILQRFIKQRITGVKEWVLLTLGFALLLLGLSEIGLIILFAVTYIVMDKVSSKTIAVEPISFSLIFALFVKIGATLYGSGYVLLSYLERSFLKYMSAQDIINAFLIGEITPGPVFTSATAVGVFLKGPIGGLLATLGIFLPSFILMLILMPLKKRILNINWIKLALDGVQIASIAMISKVVLSLISTSFLSVEAIVLLALIIVIKKVFKLNQYHLLVIGPILNIIIFSIA